MDTDGLSIEVYNGILIEAENFNHDLTLWFGVLSIVRESYYEGQV